MPPPQLTEEIKALAHEGYQIQLTEAEGMFCLVLPAYPLPRGYTRTSTDLLLMLPLSYPAGRPDMFWVEPEVVLANDAVPKNADSTEDHLGRRWRRFSWHLRSWNPVSDDLRTYLEFVNSRLVKVI